jgi:O-antigen/teichoic acid export membrane protein
LMETFRRLARHSVFSFVIYVAPRITDVLLFVLIGRWAGRHTAGVFTLATAYLSIAVTVTRGLDDLLMRQVSRKPEEVSRYLTSFMALRVGISLLGYGLLAFWILFFIDYNTYTSLMILLFGLVLIPENLVQVIQAVFLGRACFIVPAVTVSLVSVLKLGLGAWVFLAQGSLQAVALMWGIGSVVSLGVLWLIMVRQVEVTYTIDWEPVRENLRPALSFFAITALLALDGQMDTIFLSLFQDEAAVAAYRAAATVMLGFAIAAQAYQVAIYPLMSRYVAERASVKLSRLYTWSMRGLAGVVLPIVVGVWILARPIVVAIFGPTFDTTVHVLRILIFYLICFYLNAPDSRVMLVYNRQDRLAVFVACAVMINIVLNMVLDPVLGASGAAIARVGSTVALFTLNHFVVHKYYVPSNIFKLLGLPFLAALGMALGAWALAARNLWVAVSVGLVIYVLIGGGGGWLLFDDARMLRGRSRAGSKNALNSSEQT